MSLELAIWLKARRELEDVKTISNNDELISNWTNSFKNQQNREWDLRCRYAGTRGTPRAPLCEVSGDLTLLGNTIAGLVIELFQAHHDEISYKNELLDPDCWDAAD